jgi:hypothetical protein
MISIDLPIANHDHRLVRWKGRLIGFCPLDRDTIRLKNCPNCRQENYAGKVRTGRCAWCYWDAADPESGIPWNDNSSETAAR